MPEMPAKARETAPQPVRNVTSLVGARRHLAKLGATHTLCGVHAYGPGVTDHGRLTQSDIDTLPLCRTCERLSRNTVLQLEPAPMPPEAEPESRVAPTEPVIPVDRLRLRPGAVFRNPLGQQITLEASIPGSIGAVWTAEVRDNHLVASRLVTAAGLSAHGYQEVTA